MRSLAEPDYNGFFFEQRGWKRFLGHEIGIFPACALCGFRVRLPHRRNAAWRRPLKLQPQPARLLALLIQRAGETVTREELAREVWGADTFVDFEQGLNYAIRQIRTVLKDDADNPRFLETQHKRGYQFIAPLERVAVPSETLLPAPAQSLPTRRREVLQRIGYAFKAASLIVVAALVALRLRNRQLAGATTHAITSLAVLPLENLSGDSTQEYFSDGMTEELITDLAKIDSLRVISRTSVEQYKHTKRPLPEIARELAVLWGNYSSDVLGGTGKFANATGRIDYFGIADFKELTLVLRYRGRICF